MDFLTKNERLDVILALLLLFILVQEKLLDIFFEIKIYLLRGQASLHMLPPIHLFNYVNCYQH